MKSRSPRWCPKQSNGDHELVQWELLNYFRMQTQYIFMAADPASDEKALWWAKWSNDKMSLDVTNVIPVLIPIWDIFFVKTGGNSKFLIFSLMHSSIHIADFKGIFWKFWTTKCDDNFFQVMCI